MQVLQPNNLAAPGPAFLDEQNAGMMQYPVLLMGAGYPQPCGYALAYPELPGMHAPLQQQQRIVLQPGFGALSSLASTMPAVSSAALTQWQQAGTWPPPGAVGIGTNSSSGVSSLAGQQLQSRATSLAAEQGSAPQSSIQGGSILSTEMTRLHSRSVIACAPFDVDLVAGTSLGRTGSMMGPNDVTQQSTDAVEGDGTAGPQPKQQAVPPQPQQANRRKARAGATWGGEPNKAGKPKNTKLASKDGNCDTTGQAGAADSLGDMVQDYGAAASMQLGPYELDAGQVALQDSARDQAGVLALSAPQHQFGMSEATPVAGINAYTATQQQLIVAAGNMVKQGSYIFSGIIGQMATIVADKAVSAAAGSADTAGPAAGSIGSANAADLLQFSSIDAAFAAAQPVGHAGRQRSPGVQKQQQQQQQSAQQAGGALGAAPVPGSTSADMEPAGGMGHQHANDIVMVEMPSAAELAAVAIAGSCGVVGRAFEDSTGLQQQQEQQQQQPLELQAQLQGQVQDSSAAMSAALQVPNNHAAQLDRAASAAAAVAAKIATASSEQHSDDNAAVQDMVATAQAQQPALPADTGADDDAVEAAQHLLMLHGGGDEDYAGGAAAAVREAGGEGGSAGRRISRKRSRAQLEQLLGQLYEGGDVTIGQASDGTLSASGTGKLDNNQPSWQPGRGQLKGRRKATQAPESTAAASAAAAADEHRSKRIKRGSTPVAANSQSSEPIAATAIKGAVSKAGTDGVSCPAAAPGSWQSLPAARPAAVAKIQGDHAGTQPATGKGGKKRQAPEQQQQRRPNGQQHGKSKQQYTKFHGKVVLARQVLSSEAAAAAEDRPPRKIIVRNAHVPVAEAVQQKLKHAISFFPDLLLPVMYKSHSKDAAKAPAAAAVAKGSSEAAAATASYDEPAIASNSMGAAACNHAGAIGGRTGSIVAGVVGAADADATSGTVPSAAAATSVTDEQHSPEYIDCQDVEPVAESAATKGKDEAARRVLGSCAAAARLEPVPISDSITTLAAATAAAAAANSDAIIHAAAGQAEQQEQSQTERQQQQHKEAKVSVGKQQQQQQHEPKQQRQQANPLHEVSSDAGVNIRRSSRRLTTATRQQPQPAQNSDGDSGSEEDSEDSVPAKGKRGAGHGKRQQQQQFSSKGCAAAATAGGPEASTAGGTAVRNKGGRPKGSGNRNQMAPRHTDRAGRPTFSLRSAKYTGVYQSKRAHDGWRAQFCFSNKVLNLGTYETEDNAARAWNAAALYFRGEGAWLNPVVPKLPPDYQPGALGSNVPAATAAAAAAGAAKAAAAGGK